MTILLLAIRSHVQARVKDLLMEMRSLTDKPIGIGFGISGAEQVRQVRDWGADAVIVGSAFVKRLATGTPTQGLQAVEELCQTLKAAITTTEAKGTKLRLKQGNSP